MVITDTVEKENELQKWRNNPKNWLPSNSTIPNNHIVSSYYKPSKKKDVTDNVKNDLKTNMIHTMISDAKRTGNFFEIGLEEKLKKQFILEERNSKFALALFHKAEKRRAFRIQNGWDEREKYGMKSDDLVRYASTFTTEDFQEDFMETETNIINTIVAKAKSTGNFFEVGLKEKLANFFKSFISSLHEKEGKNLEFAFTLLDNAERRKRVRIANGWAERVKEGMGSVDLVRYGKTFTMEDFQKEIDEKALKNYELFYELPEGSAKLKEVKSSSAGIAGWAKYLSYAAELSKESVKEEILQKNENVLQDCENLIALFNPIHKETLMTGDSDSVDFDKFKKSFFSDEEEEDELDTESIFIEPCHSEAKTQTRIGRFIVTSPKEENDLTMVKPWFDKQILPQFTKESYPSWNWVLDVAESRFLKGMTRNNSWEQNMMLHDTLLKLFKAERDKVRFEAPKQYECKQCEKREDVSKVRRRGLKDHVIDKDGKKDCNSNDQARCKYEHNNEQQIPRHILAFQMGLVFLLFFMEFGFWSYAIGFISMFLTALLFCTGIVARGFGLFMIAKGMLYVGRGFLLLASSHVPTMVNYRNQYMDSGSHGGR